MKILKLLNKVNLSIILIFFFTFVFKSSSNEPVDIWNVDTKKEAEETKIIINESSVPDDDLEESIYENQNQNIKWKKS